MLKKHTH